MTWWQRLIRRDELESQLDRELRFHLDERISALRNAGLSEAEALRQARQEIGGMEQAKEACRDARGTAWLESTLQDFRYAARTLRKTPAFTFAVVATLALGIGANTAIFQLLDAVRLRTLPVPDPQRLAQIRIAGGHAFGISHYPDNLSYPLFEQIRQHQQAFSGILAWDSGTSSTRIGQGEQERRVPMIRVSGEFFSTLGITPAAGRLFRDEDDVRGCAVPVVVLGYQFWQNEFGGRNSVLGTRLVVENRPLEIVGVAPEGFAGTEVGAGFDIALPLCTRTLFDYGNTAFFTRRDVFWLNVMGRMKPGWTLAAASAHLEAISTDIMQATEPGGHSRVSLERYRRFRLAALPAATGISRLREEYDQSLWLLLGLTGLLLLIACANLANLMVARAGARAREFAVRVALGAGGGRLVRQALTESMLIAAGGAATGLALAAALSRAILRSLSTGNHARQLDLPLDGRMLLFTGGVASATCILLGVAPALRSAGVHPAAAMKTGGRGLTAERGRFRFQRLLVIVQVSVSLVLVAGAFLFVDSFRRLATLDPGFRAQGLLTASFDLPGAGPERRQVLDEVRATPVVDSAAGTTNLLIGSGSWSLGIRTPAASQESRFTWVTPGFFATLQTPILAGRDFTRYDTETSPKVAIVNQLFARQFFPGADPVGKTFRTVAEPNYPAAEYQIVGVVENTRYLSLQNAEPPMAYGPLSQYPPGSAGALMFLRTRAPLAAAEAAVRRRIAAWRPGTPMQFQDFARQISDSLERERLLAALSGFFGLLAALLASIGLYGVLAYQAVRRRNEIGIRLALGATRPRIVGLVLKEAALLSAIGLAIGLAGSLAASHLAESLVYGISPRDPWRLAASALALAAAVIAGSLVPARRAARFDPQAALRDE
jgi:predicted permease